MKKSTNSLHFYGTQQFDLILTSFDRTHTLRNNCFQFLEHITSLDYKDIAFQTLLFTF